MRKFIGIDLHSNNSVVVVTDDDDGWCTRSGCPTIGGDGRCGGASGRDGGVVIESTYNWYWLVDGLMDAGYPVLGAPGGDQKVQGAEQRGLC
ncbi:MAG: hypothetical protein U5L03_16730 [Burkholderiaceae bacterium]|nr:hypothetical protein [Burkholderiaceae bacterium]